MNSLKNFLYFDIMAFVNNFFIKHINAIKLISVLYLLNILIYGKKIFYYSLPSDDYMRFWGDDNVAMLITNSARWAQALLNKYIFIDALQIMPYFHTLIGVFCLTLMGYLSARFWGLKDDFQIALITLLISATPSFAHNLYFSTNITTWLTMLLGLNGAIMIYKGGVVKKIFGTLFLIISIANYQSIIQIVILLLIFKVFIDILNKKSIKKSILNALIVVIFTIVAYIISYSVNEWFLHHYHLSKVHRLAQSEQKLSFQILVNRIISIYKTKIAFNYFADSLNTLYIAILTLSVIGILYFSFKNIRDLKDKFIVTLILIFGYLLTPILIHLPLLLGVDIPIRAYFPLGWAVAGAITLIMIYFKNLFKSLIVVLSLSLITVNIYYISIFFDACYRQTQADIARAREIVERIRNHPNYIKEPIGFYIVGNKPFNVKGWSVKWQQPFNSYWARYKIFQHFTDFKFHMTSSAELKKIEQYLIQKGKEIHSYPYKNSVIVYNNNAVLFLNADGINATIKKEKYLKNISLNRKPDIKAKFNIYVENNVTYMYKKSCTKEDRKKRFFFRIYPKDPQNTFVNGKRIYSHQTWDFNFDFYGKVINNNCLIAVELPKYKIDHLHIGQFKDGKIDWEVTYD